MRAERPIISHPERQVWTQQLTSITLTLGAWAMWGYLWLPALAVILWIFGIHLDSIYKVRVPDLSTLLLMILIVLACDAIVRNWAGYNRRRFAGKSRRLGSNAIPHPDVGKAFGVNDAATLSLLLQERRLSMYFDDAGTLIRVVAEGADKKEDPAAE